MMTIRYSSVLLLVLCTLLLFSPSLVTPSTAITVAEAADAGDSVTGDVSLDDSEEDDIAVDEDDEEDDDDDDDLSMDEDDQDEDDDEDSSEGDDDEVGDNSVEVEKPAVIDPEGDEKATHTPPKATGAIFFDNFQSGLNQWTHSENPEYNGKFAVGQGAKPTIRGDRALIIPEKARKYGLSAPISGLGDLNGKDLVVQYELKMEEGVTCGGAYIKLPLTDFVPKDLTGDTKYSVMFGPDKCGATDKVHFIYQSLNPKTDKLVEHHLKTPPTIANSYDKKTHLYTLIVRADGSFEVKIDMEKKSSGNLSDKFEPPVQPAEKIDDPSDSKPADWVDEKKIPDPDATKPDDWDEDAPKQISDDSAVKPEGWLDDEPLKIKDPNAEQPDTWDEEEDGEWDPPTIANPKCEAVGCGKWKAPMIDNPDYKGKWKAPLIDNPKYVGEWSPKQIDNPEFYTVEKAGLLGIGGVAFEIWTMDQGVLFDNLYIGSSEEDAESYANATFVVKQKTELKKEEEERKEEEAKQAKQQKEAGGKKHRPERTTKLGKSLGPIMDKIEDAVDKMEDALKPLEMWLQKNGMEPYLDKLINMGIEKPMLLVVLMPITITLLMLSILGGGKKDDEEEEESVANTQDTTESTMTDAEKKKSDAESKDDDDGDKDNEQNEDADETEENIEPEQGEENGIEATGLRQRKVASDE